MVVLPSLQPHSSSVYYGGSSTFNLLSPVAVLYTAAAHLVVGLLRPTPFRLVPKSLPPGPPTIPNAATSASSKSKVAIVTGSNTGIGFETASDLVERGYTVVMACRSRDKALQAIERINKKQSFRKNSCGGEAVFCVPLDLSSFQSVHEFATAVLEKYDSIDVLVNNAGRNSGGQSERNLDLCFQSNHLGHFLLTKLLLASILKDGGGRVINLASVMHHFAETPEGRHDVEFWKDIAQFSETSTKSRYTPSKLAALLFTLELNRRYASQGLRSIAVNPGAVNSDIWRNFPRWLVALFRLIYLTSNQGASTSVAAATMDFPDNVKYLTPYWIPSWMGVPVPFVEMLGPYVGYCETEPRLPDDGSKGIATAQHMWKASEELTNCVFP